MMERGRYNLGTRALAAEGAAAGACLPFCCGWATGVACWRRLAAALGVAGCAKCAPVVGAW